MKKKKIPLYFVELHGIEDHEYLLVDKQTIDWILRGIPLDDKHRNKLLKSGLEVEDIEKLTTAKECSLTRENDRALNSQGLAIQHFTAVWDYIKFLKRNKRYIIKNGFYGGIY